MPHTSTFTARTNLNNIVLLDIVGNFRVNWYRNNGKKWFFKKPRAVTYIDGPFYPKDGLTKSENIEYLHSAVYETMKERAKAHSNYVYYEYKRKENENG